MACCGECEWEYTVESDDPTELSRAMIDHFVETGHSPVQRCDDDDGEQLTFEERTESEPEPTGRRREPPTGR